MRRVMTFTIQCEWDAEANVWYVADSNVPGLAAEASSQEEMNVLLRERVPELLRLNQDCLAERLTEEVPMELLYKKHESLKVACN